MTVDRRNDLGSKVLISVLALLVTVIMGFSINTACEALSRANANSCDIASLRESSYNVKEILNEIKLEIRGLRAYLQNNG